MLIIELPNPNQHSLIRVTQSRIKSIITASELKRHLVQLVFSIIIFKQHFIELKQRQMLFTFTLRVTIIRQSLDRIVLLTESALKQLIDLLANLLVKVDFEVRTFISFLKLKKLHFRYISQ